LTNLGRLKTWRDGNEEEYLLLTRAPARLNSKPEVTPGSAPTVVFFFGRQRNKLSAVFNLADPKRLL
jgi:hypothetical protein